MQNPETKRRAVIAALIAAAVVAVLVIAIRANGGGDPPEPTQAAQVDQQTSDQGQGGVELGSLALSAFRCPALSSPDVECIESGAVELTAFTMTLPDGQVLSLANAQRVENGAYQWLNIPIGSYELKSVDFQGPTDLAIRNISGPAEPIEGGWRIGNLDPNQPAVINILYAPTDGSPAAG